MRLSLQPNDRGTLVYEAMGTPRMRVFLDGVEQMDVVTADTDLGVIYKHVLTEEGKLAVDYAKGRVLTECHMGKVEVKPWL